MTRDVLAIPPGAWLLQSAAGGELGKMVIRLGKKYGFRTLNVVRRREQVEELKTLGADAVIVEGDGPMPEQVQRSHRTACVTRSTRSAGRPVLASSHRSRPAAAACSTARCPTSRSRFTPASVIGNDLRVEGFWLGDWAKQQALLAMLRLFRRVRA